MLRKLFNRRKHQRFIAAQDTYIIFNHKTNNETKLQIIEISEGGCKFVYHGDENNLGKFVTLISGSDAYLDHIKISTVNNKHPSGLHREICAQFRPQGPVEKERLKRFINKVSICKY